MPYYRTREAKRVDYQNKCILADMPESVSRELLDRVYDAMTGRKWNSVTFDLLGKLFKVRGIKFLPPEDLVETKEEMEWKPTKGEI
jgi:hypothetical protein